MRLTFAQNTMFEQIKPLFRHDVPPTLEAIAQRAGLSSRGAAHGLVEKLIAAGKLRRNRVDGMRPWLELTEQPNPLAMASDAALLAEVQRRGL